MFKEKEILNKWTLLGIMILYIFVDVIQYLGSPIIIKVFFFLQLILALLLPRIGVISLIIAFFLFDDMAYLPRLEPIFHSYYSCLVGGQTLSTITTVLFIIIIIIQTIKQKRFPIGNWFLRLFFLLFLVGIINGVLRGNLRYLGEFIADFRFYLNFIVGFLIIDLLYRKHDYRFKIIPILGMIFICKGLVLLYKSILLASSGTIYTIVADTGSYLSVFFMTYFIYLLTDKSKSRFIPLIGVISLLIILGVSASRGRFVIVTISVLFFLWSSKRMKYLPLIVASGIGLVLLIPLISPEMGNYVIWKLTSFKPREGQGESSLVRFVEFANILHQNTQDLDSFIFGEGLAGSWRSNFFQYPFNLIGSDSYPDLWIRQDRFFKPHGIIQFMLLKSGIVGTVLFFTSLFILFLKRKFVFMREKISSPEKANMTLILTAGFVTFFLVAYSAKLQFFGGVLFSIFHIYVKESKENSVAEN